MDKATETYVTTKEAAAITGLAVQTLHNWRLEAKGPAYVRAGRKAIRYSTTALHEWMQARTVNPGGDQR